MLRSDRAAFGAAAVAFGIASICLWLVPPSEWLVRWSPDGALQPIVAQFLDQAWWLALGAALQCAAAAVIPSGAAALRGAVSRHVAPATTRRSMLAIWCIAIVAGIACVIAAALGDAGLGDDGARNVWLMHWLSDPHFIRGGLWAPGHLYLHALLWVPLQDVVRAGMLLSVLATIGCIAILGFAAARCWGGAAGIFGAALAAVLPVSMAYGSISDVNPLFAFAMLAAVAAAKRAGRDRRWLLAAWLGMACAAWSRFEAFLLIPAVLIPLWPHWRTMLAFGVACALPTLAWHALNFLDSGDALRVLNAVQADPTLQSSRFASVFDFFGAGWKAITLPVALLGVCGMVRALRSARGREWMPLAILHVGALAAATVQAGTGNQARYLILVAFILAHYAGVAIAGIARVSRPWGVLVFVLALGLIVVLPGKHPDRHGLWVCRDDHLRGVVDCVAAARIDGALVWIADEATCFYPCRTGFPVQRYHPMPRADSDPHAIVAALQAEPHAWLCRRENAASQALVQAFLDAAGATWSRGAVVVQCSDYVLYRLDRRNPEGAAAAGRGSPP